MAVTIDSGPVAADDLARNVPREKWRELLEARRRFCEVNLSYDCRCLVQFVNEADQMFCALGFESRDAMVRDGYGLEPEEIKIAVEWLTLNPQPEPVGIEVARALAEHGGDRRSEKARADQGDNVTLKSRGHSRAYILARLDRDGHAELAAKVHAGEMSANKAAQEAGFRKKLTPYETIVRLLPKLTTSERKQLRGLL